MPHRESTGIRGCFHIHIENGKIKNVFSHLSDFPENGVIHLLPSHNYTIEEFKESHKYDGGEVDVPYEGTIHQLGPKSVIVNDDGTVETKVLLGDDELDDQDKGIV